MKYLHFSIFLGNLERHGGGRRSEQISELLENSGLAGISVNPYFGILSSFQVAFRHPLLFLEAILFSIYLCFKCGLSLIGVVKFSIYSVNLIKNIKGTEFDVLLHETAPGVSIPFMQYLKWKGVPYIAIPHNIECLVPGQVIDMFRNECYVYLAEMTGYRAAQRVISICKFDAAILRSAGVLAEVLEYHPVRNDRVRFDYIRKSRGNCSEAVGFLLLGSAGNVPTYYGIKGLLEYFSQIDSDFCLTVAGYGTEVFKSYQNKKITVMGSVSEQEIDSLLINATALLINQPQTTGFLTKIVEMNLCGVPQIVVSDYFQIDGMERFGIIKTKIEYLSNCTIPDVFSFFQDIGSRDILREVLFSCRV